MSFLATKMVKFVILLAAVMALSLMAVTESSPTGPSSTTITSSSSSTTKSVSATIGRTEVTLKQAIRIIEKRRLKECVARTICQLSCDANALGDKGQAVYHTLQQFESDTLPQLAYYKTARDNGQTLDKSECNECSDTLYPNCKTSTDTLLRLANALTIKA